MMKTFTLLDDETARTVLDAAGRARQSDGVFPLNEAARTALTSANDHEVTHWIISDAGQLTAYAQLDHRDESVQLFVDPRYRRQGLGRALVNTITSEHSTSFWAFGNLPEAQEFAVRLGLSPKRELVILSRDLKKSPPRQITTPSNYVLDHLREGDLDALHATNAAAFATHPEQGSLTRSQLASRLSSSALRDIVIARDSSGHLVGFHWIKRHTPRLGEVYVIAVHPEHMGLGLGHTLLEAGLARLTEVGVQKVILYAEGNDERLVRLYRNANFITLSHDVAYSRQTPASEDIMEETAAEPSDELPPDRYSDREMSWLAFNNRVLDLAKDALRVPLLERIKFVAIFSSNLDEFFMVRVAGLKRRIDAGVAVPSVTGALPRELHDSILNRTHELVKEQAELFQTVLRPELASQGIHIVDWSDLSTDELERMHELFADRIFPILTPLAVDPSHPFPYISGLSLNLAVLLRNPQTGSRQFARVKVPPLLNRFVRLDETRFLPLEEVIIHHLDQLFTGMQVLQHTTFRVTRNEDLEVEEDDAENLLYALEKELLRRKVGRPPVRLEVEETIGEEMLDLLVRELSVTPKEVFRLPAPLDLTGLFTLASIDREDLLYPNFLPRTHPHLAEVETSRSADVFAAIKKRDVLLHHPYHSFSTSVQRFIEQAAADPQVLAIKQTLYRTSGDSPIVDALIEAAMAGKQVLALVEIKARFDEQANIAWARKLEKYGVHVVYGMVGLKTHCKLALVVREEAGGLHRYAHVGTGNYHPKTARQYEDMGLLTSNPIITEDVARVFNHLSGMSQEVAYRRLLVAPHGIRTGLIERIEAERANRLAGLPAGIQIKVNSLVDEEIIDALYRASQAGVEVKLWVRGICALKPGVPGLSENITVISILGRFLEHSRIFWFSNGGHPSVGIGSSDLMHRNLDRRVEVIVNISNPEHIAEITSMFDLAFDDQTVTWRLHGSEWTPRTTDAEGNPLRDSQSYLIEQSSQRRH